MAELIVALDRRENFRLAQMLAEEADVTWFKIGPQALLDLSLIKLIPSAKIFLDLKLYDTAATISETVKRCDDYGIAALSVVDYAHVTDAALCAAELRPIKLWSIFWLSDDKVSLPTEEDWRDAAEGLQTSGIICPAPITNVIETPRDVVAVGVRLPIDAWDGHNQGAMPSAASFAVVGRPIWASSDPVSSARRYIEALSGPKYFS